MAANSPTTLVVVLLASNCFNCLLTAAQLLNVGTSYTPKASFPDIMRFAYFEEYSGDSFPCLTLDIEAGPSDLGVKTYTATYTFFNDGTLQSEQSLFETDLAEGQAQSSISSGSGTPDPVQLTIVGFVGGRSGFRGYALASHCSLDDGSKGVLILLKNEPPDSAVVRQLKAQLPGDLRNITLSEIPHDIHRVYPQH